MWTAGSGRARARASRDSRQDLAGRQSVSRPPPPPPSTHMGGCFSSMSNLRVWSKIRSFARIFTLRSLNCFDGFSSGGTTVGSPFGPSARFRGYLVPSADGGAFWRSGVT